MKAFSLIVKFVIIPSSSIVGILYGFDLYVVDRANTAVKPVKVEVVGVSKRQDDLIKVMDSRMNAMDEKLNILMSK